MHIEILFEDENFLIVNKPTGLVVHATLDKSRDNLFDLVKSDREYLGLLHRLDKDTSGCILFTKNEEINSFVQEGFETHSFEKKYWAIVHGEWKIDAKVEMFLRKIKNEKKQDIMTRVNKGGQKSISKVKTIFSNTQYSLMEFTLLTGRMHQIRAQAKHSGHPIVGDLLYGNKMLDNKITTPRMFLHSHCLTFVHGEKTIEAIAPVGTQFENWIEKCK
jgi:RluA family pseudouridine synthase